MLYFPAVGFQLVKSQRQRDIFPDVQPGNQVIALKYKSDIPPPKNRQRVGGKGIEVGAVDCHASSGGSVDAAQEMQQRTLAAAAGTNHGDKCAAFNGQSYPVQCAQRIFSISVHFCQLIRLYEHALYSFCLF